MNGKPISEEHLRLVLSYISGEKTAVEVSKELGKPYSNTYQILGMRILKACRNGQLKITRKK